MQGGVGCFLVVAVCLCAALVCSLLRRHRFVVKQPLEVPVLASNGSSKCDGGRKELAPSLLYLGFGHSGSTLLADVLNDHPFLSYGDEKEIRFFCAQSLQFNYKGRLRKSLKQCISNYRVSCSTRIAIDFTPHNFAMALNRSHAWFSTVGRETCRDQLAVKPHRRTPDYTSLPQILGRLPRELRFFIMIRNPVDFLSSMYYKEIKFKWHNEEMQRLACYADVLEAWRKVLPYHEIHVLAAEDMFTDPDTFFPDLFKWIGVPNLPLWQRYMNLSEEERPGRRRHQHKTMQQYKAFFATPHMVDCKRRLEELTHRKFNWKGAE